MNRRPWILRAFLQSAENLICCRQRFSLPLCVLWMEVLSQVRVLLNSGCLLRTCPLGFALCLPNLKLFPSWSQHQSGFSVFPKCLMWAIYTWVCQFTPPTEGRKDTRDKGRGRSLRSSKAIKSLSEVLQKVKLIIYNKSRINSSNQERCYL